MSVVLVVDDDADLRETLCDVLQCAGHSTRSLAPFITHLVQAKRLSAKEKEEIRRLLEE